MKNNVTVTDVINVYYQETNNWKREHFQPRGFNCLALFTHGEIEYKFQDRTLIAKEGEFLFLPCDTPYCGKKHSEKVAFFVLDFSCLTNIEYVSLGVPCVIKATNYEEYVSEFQKILNMWESQSQNVYIKIKSLLYTALLEIDICSNIEQVDDLSQKILTYIENNLSNSNLTASELCQNFFISESQLRRRIRKATGKAPNDYISTLRINRAKSDLSYSSKTVKQIATENGFSSQYYFSRCFSKTTGMSPSKYRTLTSI